MRERVVDVLLFLLAQTDEPSCEDWLNAIDDMFSELSEREKVSMAEAGMAMLAAERARSVPVLSLIAPERPAKGRPSGGRMDDLTAAA